MKVFIAYLLIAVGTIGWNWHRACALDPAFPRWDIMDRFFCSTATGIAWPIYWGYRGTIGIFDPANMPTIRLPTVKFD